MRKALEAPDQTVLMQDLMWCHWSPSEQKAQSPNTEKPVGYMLCYQLRVSNQMNDRTVGVALWVIGTETFWPCASVLEFPRPFRELHGKPYSTEFTSCRWLLLSLLVTNSSPAVEVFWLNPSVSECRHTEGWRVRWTGHRNMIWAHYKSLNKSHSWWCCWSGI